MNAHTGTARAPEPVWDLLRRIKAVENRPDGWSDAVASDVLSGWFLDHGVDPNASADQIPAADDQPHVYERAVHVTCTSRFQLDERDLDSAIAAAVTGTGVRVEDEDSSVMHWVELEADEVTRPDGEPPRP